MLKTKLFTSISSLIAILSCNVWSQVAKMVWDSFNENAIIMLVVYKMAAIIMSYLDNSNYFFLDKNESKNNSILGDFIYWTIFSLIYTCYFNACKPIKKLLHFLKIYLSD